MKKHNHSAIKTSVLRDLTVRNTSAFLSAASGLVCAFGSAYVVADDQQFLTRFRNAHDLGEPLVLSSNSLPLDAKLRKQKKHDYETLLLLPSRNETPSSLVALGSGSGPNRNRGGRVNLDSTGQWIGVPLTFDLLPIYSDLLRKLGDLNIEGGFVTCHPTSGQKHLVLLNRAVAGKSANTAIFFPASVLYDALNGEYKNTKPQNIVEFELGDLEGIGLGFTDAAALDDGGWLFCAAAEDRSDSFNDGACAGSVIGRVSSNNTLTAIKRLDKKVKVEGIAVQPQSPAFRNNERTETLKICLVTDADNPALVSQMLTAQFEANF
jgi:hypothetical protein